MDVSEALARRFTCRAFLPKAVPGHAVEHVLRVAGRAPSAGNVQPWQVWALAGAPLEALKAQVRAHTREGQLFETAPEYTIYPEEMGEPYATRRFRNGEAWYGALRIARDDHAARMGHVAENFELYGAPVGIFVAIERTFGVAQWLDLGIFLQSLMLAAAERGLDTAPLESWAFWHPTVRAALEMPENLMLVCAVAVGYADHEARGNAFRSERAPLEEWTHFAGFDEALHQT